MRIAGFESVLSSINSLGLQRDDLGDLVLRCRNDERRATAGADADKNGVLDVVEALRGLRSGGGTNYEAALQQAETFYKGAPSGQNVLFFLSDAAAGSRRRPIRTR
ncbi:MAG: hypothetical protein U1E60_07200 [Reyranellaceae bacterium]